MALSDGGCPVRSGDIKASKGMLNVIPYIC